MLDVLQYVVTQLAWSGAGFILGYFVCNLEREVHEIRGVLVDSEEEGGPHMATHRTTWRRISSRSLRNLGIFVVILSILTVASMTLSNIKANQTIECQNRVTRDLRADQLQRGQRVDADWLEMRLFLEELYDAAGDVPATKRALRKLLDNFRERDQQRALKPPIAYIEDEC